MRKPGVLENNKKKIAHQKLADDSTNFPIFSLVENPGKIQAKIDQNRV